MASPLSQLGGSGTGHYPRESTALAVYPCSIGSHRYGGAQKSAYLTDCSDSRPKTRKLRLCARHYEQIAEQVSSVFQLIEDDTDSQASMTCTVGDCAEVRGSILFVKLFPGGEEYTQWAADLCAAHGAMALQAIGWDGAIAL